jgi:hypothetical protein
MGARAAQKRIFLFAGCDELTLPVRREVASATAHSRDRPIPASTSTAMEPDPNDERLASNAAAEAGPSSGLRRFLMVINGS